ncbi:MAG TPA: DUF3106 domain-containing protein [Burkholderiaceae bacterium]|jgi:hypothetical protein
MTPADSHLPRRPAHSSRRGTGWAAIGAALVVGLAGLGAVSWAGVSHAQAVPALAPTRPGPVPVAEQGVRWRDLKPGQQAVLKPLEREWPKIGSAHKQKWIELSGNFGRRSPAEQARIQGRMAEWARLTAEERGQARLNFQDAKDIDPNDRKARWQAYQALSPEQKQRLAARAAHAAPSTASGARPVRVEAAVGREAQTKSNVVPNTALAAPPKVIAPGVLQARPGATTTLITKRPTPPSHQQTGLPKIAATPEFVNKATLLPRRGPQGAATRSATAPASEPSLAQ